jgi:ribosomal protein S18 acetylase RimI-like enzyme
MNIELLQIADYNKCNNIWNMKNQSELADKFYQELLSGNRITYICKDGDKFMGEISLVEDMADSDYTIPEQRIYVSHLVVKPEYRCQGIGKTLVEYVTDNAKQLGYTEMSIGVELDNYPALKLYIDCGFDKVIYIGEDEQGKYVKLLKAIYCKHAIFFQKH